MTGHDVLRVLDALHLAEVAPIIEGGWGIDALVGRQSRVHNDLDLSVAADELNEAIHVLDVLGYSAVSTHTPGWMRASTADGRSVELQPLTNDLHQHLEGGREFRYDRDHLDGRGFIVGRPVRCLNIEAHILNNAGPEPSERAYADLHLLADAAGARLPAPFGRGNRVDYRRAEAADYGAMAAVHAAYLHRTYASPDAEPPAANALPYSFGSTADLAAARPDQLLRYWRQRCGLTDSWVGVATEGAATVGSLGVVRWLGPELDPSKTGVLFGFNAHPIVWGQRLLDPLVHQGVAAANALGFSDIRVFCVKGNDRAAAFWSRLGWTRDGFVHSVGSELLIERYSR